MSSRPYMPMWIGDYLAATPHLSTTEHGAYLLLLFAYWQRGGPLPNDSTRLANIARLPLDAWTSIEATILEFFDCQNGLLIHRRAEHELARFREKSAQAARAGRASAERRSNVRSTGVQRTSNHPYPNPHQNHNQWVSSASVSDSARAISGSEANRALTFDAVTGVEVAVASEQVRAAIPPRTMLRVARRLGIADPSPIVDAFVDWRTTQPAHKQARNVAALFTKAAATIFDNLPPDARQRCGRAEDDPAEIKPKPVQASADLCALHAEQMKAIRIGGQS